MLDADLPKVRLAGVQLSEIEAAIPAIQGQLTGAAHTVMVAVSIDL